MTGIKHQTESKTLRPLCPKAWNVQETEPKKDSKPRNLVSHPTYKETIKDAIVSLKEKNGSSQYAIVKFIKEKQKQLPGNFKKLLLQNLKKNVAFGKPAEVKGSFKLSAAAKKPAVAKPSQNVKRLAANTLDKDQYQQAYVEPQPHPQPPGYKNFHYSKNTGN
ncbi:hypothetical protein KIW84_063916 [Lathyrus oleraceus]|uniref:H15 domain-containing protein n=1 Tax=Pisum sativum TaxID=3888 RepID=A0A9D4WB61_PEA|nr:hypothetical protein KIW84_063916 [Pisum sativum]